MPTSGIYMQRKSADPRRHRSRACNPTRDDRARAHGGRFATPLLYALLVAGGSLLSVQPAHAQGSGVYIQSACMNARNGAGVAAPCDDGSAVYYNPAALAHQNGAVSLGVTLIDQTGSFTFDDTGIEVERDPSSTAVPHGWATHRLSPRLGVGLGVWVPYGLSLQWPVCPNDALTCGAPNFEGRFVGYDQSLRGLYLQPTVAYDLLPGRLSLGAGLDIVRGEVEINRRLDLSEASVAGIPLDSVGIPNDTDFADLKLEGDGWGVTGHVGALFNLTDAISLGARYMHEVTVDMEGPAGFRQIPTGLAPLPPFFDDSTPVDALVRDSLLAPGRALADQSVTTSFTLPSQAVVGISVQLDPSLRVVFDLQWTQWSAWDSVVVDLEIADDEVLILDYQDAKTYRFGADYRLSDQMMLHGGFTYNEAAAKPASVSPFLPDSERYYISGGVSFRLTERFSLHAFGMTIRAGDRRGRVVDRESIGDTADMLNEGVYSSEGQLYGVSVTYHLGGAR